MWAVFIFCLRHNAWVTRFWHFQLVILDRTPFFNSTHTRIVVYSEPSSDDVQTSLISNELVDFNQLTSTFKRLLEFALKMFFLYCLNETLSAVHVALEQIYIMWHTLMDWLKGSPCSMGCVGLSLLWRTYCVETVSVSFVLNCSPQSSNDALSLVGGA